MGRCDEAIQFFDKAIQHNPNNEWGRINKGNCLRNLGRLGWNDEAIKYYDRAIQLNPNQAEAWNGKAVALSYLDKFDEAVKS